MELIYTICRSLSLGIILGFLLGGLRLFKRPRYTEQQIEATRRKMKNISNVFKYITFMALALGLTWCIYYLILGIYDPEQSGYATNMSQLIVSVLTVISIIFAFFEFLRDKPGKDE